MLCRSGVLGDCAAGEFRNFCVSNGRDSHTGSIVMPGLYSTVVIFPRISWPDTGSQTVANALFFREAKRCALLVWVGLLSLLTWTEAPEALQTQAKRKQSDRRAFHVY